MQGPSWCWDQLVTPSWGGGCRFCNDNLFIFTDRWDSLCYHRADCHLSPWISSGTTTKGNAHLSLGSLSFSASGDDESRTLALPFWKCKLDRKMRELQILEYPSWPIVWGQSLRQHFMNARNAKAPAPLSAPLSTCL